VCLGPLQLWLQRAVVVAPQTFVAPQPSNLQARRVWNDCTSDDTGRHVSTLQEQVQERLGDDFHVEAELGGGGMSRVFRARDRRLDRLVVVKVLRPELAVGVSVERFRREIRTAAALQHALIVPVLDVGDLDGLPYFLMPFVDGESLRRRLSRGPMAVVDTVRILRDVARALAVAHARGVVHRDIKPDNVLLSGDAAVVADFGVAKAFAVARHEEDIHASGKTSITTAGMSLGTPAYMAPEQVAADPNAGAAMDLYAFGVMAYEMLTGATPFSGRSPQATMAAHVTETPDPVFARRPDVPAALNTLVMTCLEKDPHHRPPSAAALVELLEDPSVLSGSFTPIPDDAAAAITGSGTLKTSMLLATASGGNAVNTPARRGATSLPATTTGAPDAAVSSADPNGSTRYTARPVSGGRVAFAAAAVVIVAAGAWRWAQQRSSQAETRASASAVNAVPAIDTTPSVAVLPFVYLSADTARAFMARAIADAVTDGLTRVPGLRVSSRSGAEALQRRLVSGDTARLPVRTLVEGVVEEENGLVRLTVRLVDAHDGFTLFADRIEGARDSLFALEDDIAAAMRDRLMTHFGFSDSLRTPSSTARD